MQTLAYSALVKARDRSRTTILYMKRPPIIAYVTGSLLAVQAFAQVTLTGTSYVENFNGIGDGVPVGWSVRTGANSSTLGSTATLTTALTSWGTTTGNFRNVASTTGLTSSSSVANQEASSNRAMGVRQTGSFGDPGAAFIFNFNSTGMTLSSISLDALMLSVQANSTTWTIDYGIGASPSSFTSLGSYSDPGVWGTTPISITGSSLAGLSNQSNVWIRFVALTATTAGGTRDTVAIDNFTINYSAIPEPSTYAALAGVLALGGVMWHRRRKAQKAV